MKTKIIPMFAAMMITGGVIAAEETKPAAEPTKEETVVDKAVDTADGIWETVKGWFN